MNPYVAHHIGLSNHQPVSHKLLLIDNGKNEMHRKVHHHASNYDDLEIFFRALNHVECDESQSPPSLCLAVKLGIRKLILSIDRNRLIPRIEVLSYVIY